MKLKFFTSKKYLLYSLSAFVVLCGLFTASLVKQAAASVPVIDLTHVDGQQCVAHIDHGSVSSKISSLDNAVGRFGDVNALHNNLQNGMEAEFGRSQTKFKGVDAADLADVTSSISKDSNAYIYFSANNGSNDKFNAICGTEAFFWQSASSSKSTTFYGIADALTSDPNGNGSNYTFIKISVNPSQKTMNITTTYSDGNNTYHKNYPDLAVDDPSKLFLPPKIDTYFPSGGGTVSGGGSCLGKAITTDDVNKCLSSITPGATVQDAATITLGKETYVAQSWGGDAIHYKLTKSDDAQRQANNTSGGAVPEITMDTTSWYDDLNLDNDGNAQEVTEFAKALANLSASGHLEKNAFHYTNYDYKGNPSGGAKVILPTATQNMNILFNYSPKDNAASMVFGSGGGNESHYIGTYKKVDATHFALSGGGFSACNSAPPTVILGSAPTADTVVGGTFNMTAPDCSLPPSGSGFPVRIHALAADASLPPSTTGSTGTSSDGDALDCDFDGNPLTWIVCPVVDGIKAFVSKVDTYITQSLQFDRDGTTVFSGDNMASYYAAWNSFRVIGTAIIIIGALVMVAAQSFGFEILDAYTTRKVLPRLLVAVIGMSLSWPLMRFMVDFFNILGVDVRQLIWAPFSGIKGTLESGALLTANLGLLSTGLFLGIAGALSFAGTAILGLLIGFAIIVFRDIALLLIIIVAPLAIACYVLPNTQKVWKLWSDNFLGLLVVFPIIEAFIAIGRVFSAISLGGTLTNAPTAGTVQQVIGFAAYFAPYFLLPVAFRLGTGFIGTIAGFANDRSRGVFDRLKKGRQTRMADRFQRAQNNSLWDNNSRVGKLANKTASWATDPLSNTKYYGRNIPGLRKGGQKIAGQLEHAGVEQSGKLFEELNKMGYNDKAFRLLSGNYNKNSASASERAMAAKLEAAGIKGAPTSIGDLQKAAHILQSGSETEQIAANAIHGSMGRLATLYQDPEMGKANIQAAGLMGLSAHGFASGDDLANAGNGLQKSAGKGFANSILTQSTLLGQRSRPDTKPGYGFVYEGGQFKSGIAAGRGMAALQTLSPNDLAGAKGGAVDAFKPIIKKVIEDGRAPGATAEQQAQATAVQEQMFSWAGQYSQASVDVKTRTLQMIDEFNIRPEFNANQQRGNGAVASGAVGGPPTPPTPPPTPGGAAGGAGGTSDRRLKRGITYLETDEQTQIKLYRFKYLWSDQEYVGVMAQDLVDSHPEALSTNELGFYRVNYAALGLRMQTIEEWESTRSASKIR